MYQTVSSPKISELTDEILNHITEFQFIEIPALEYPATVLISDEPVAVAENTNSRRVFAVTGIDNPVKRPLLTAPTNTAPVSVGTSVTAVPAIGEKILSGVVELYNCAVMVMMDPVSAKSVVVLKYAVIDVMVPLRGTEKAKLVFIPGPPVRSMVGPKTVVSVALAPNPI